jgi:hypothetical protein
MMLLKKFWVTSGKITEMQSSREITASDFTCSSSLFNPKLITELANIATRMAY